jgi:hypothetical protein
MQAVLRARLFLALGVALAAGWAALLTWSVIDWYRGGAGSGALAVVLLSSLLVAIGFASRRHRALKARLANEAQQGRRSY